MVPREDVEKLFAWAERNSLALFPILAWCKRPTGIVRSHAEDWSRSPVRWRQWYQDTGGCNFGVACGPSRLIVVDWDTDEHGIIPALSPEDNQRLGLMFPWTAKVRTPSNGRHDYYRITGYETTTMRQPDLAKRVNIRAGRGYVVSPWSVTDNRIDPSVRMLGSYRLLNVSDRDIRQATEALVQHCLPAPEASRPPMQQTEHGFDAWGLPDKEPEHTAARRRRDEVQSRLMAAVPGERNARLNEAAFEMGKLVAAGLHDEAAATAMLEDCGTTLGLTRDEIRATARSGMRAAPRVGRPEPRSGLGALLAAAVPLQPPPERRPPATAAVSGGGLPEPVVERLLYEGAVTLLSGGAGSGKTSFVASLAAASCVGLRDFRVETIGPNASDVLSRSASWVFASWEGGQYVERTVRAWHEGTNTSSDHPPFACDALRFLPQEGCLVYSSRREVAVNEVQARVITEAIEQARKDRPDRPVVVVIDSATAAVENPTDPVQAQTFMRALRTLAGDGVAVLATVHPPKARSSVVYGSHVFGSLADIVADMTVLRRADGAWTQWIDFDEKHREAPNGFCLEVRSRRLGRPIVELDAAWGGGNERARARQIRDLHVPYVFSIRVRPGGDREAAARGVERVEAVSEKPVTEMRV